jgi:hypothetical protein
MIFGVQSGKAARDGDLINDFFNKYNSIKSTSLNIGWDIIRMYPEA